MAKDKPKAKKKDKADKDEKKKKKKKASTNTKDVKGNKAKKNGKPKTKASKHKKKVSPEERIEMIRTAAYYLAQKRGYHGDYELNDWIEAEKEIDATTK